MQSLFEFKILPSIWLFIQSERWLVLGFCPHAASVGVFGINLSTLVPILGSFEGGAQHSEQGNRTNNALSLSLSHRSLSKVGATPGVRKTARGALTAPDRETDPSHSAFLWHYAE